MVRMVGKIFNERYWIVINQSIYRQIVVDSHKLSENDKNEV